MKTSENNAIILAKMTRHTCFCHVFSLHQQRTLSAIMMYMAFILYIFSCCITNIAAFNLENRLPIVKYGDSDTYFGYSVAGHEIGDEDKEKW